MSEEPDDAWFRGGVDRELVRAVCGPRRAVAEPLTDADWEKAREWCRILEESGKHSGRDCWDCRKYAAALAEAREEGRREERRACWEIADAHVVETPHVLDYCPAEIRDAIAARGPLEK